MFQKSLQILVLAALVALAAIVAYASLELTGPDETLADAQARADRGENARAIALLNVIERDVRGDTARTERIWRLRAELAARMGQYGAALEDVRRLVKAHPDDEDLPLEAVRLLALSGDGAGALRAAEDFLAKHPTHGRGLELAGEASQTLYQPLLRETMQRLERELPQLDRDAAREAAWSFLYRPSQDPGIEAARRKLAALHAEDPRLLTLWAPLERQLTALRDQVQRSLDYYRGSLEAEGEPVAAFRAVALALDQSRRIDDLLAQCEIMRRRFDHEYVAEAGAAAAWSLLREGQAPAAVATTNRWLGLEPLQVAKPFRSLTSGQLDLMTARAYAAFVAGDRVAGERQWRDAGQLWPVYKVAPVLLPVAAGLFEAKTEAWKYAENSLKFAAALLAQQPVAIDRLDMLPTIAGLHLQALAHRNAPEADRQAVLRDWQRARPGTKQPLLAAAELQRTIGRPRAAAVALQAALALDPKDDQAFAAYVAAMRDHARTTGPDGAALLQQCFARRANLPEVADPTGFLFCAEAALAVGKEALALARNCATAAIDAFPQARMPHELALRVFLASELPDEAVKAADRLLAGWQPDGPGVVLALRAYAAAKKAPTPTLARAMTAAPSPELQAALIEQALADAPATAATYAAPVTRAATANPQLLLLASRAYAAANAPATAQRLLDAALAAPGNATPPAEVCRAVAAWLVAAAAASDDVLATQFRAWRARAAADDPQANRELVTAATALADERPRAALAAIELALADAPPELRTGRMHTLAGRLAARRGDLRLAEERLTAALAFADGRDGAEDLARLCLGTGRPDRAQQVRALVDAPTDLGLALRFEQLDVAAAITSGRLTSDPADLAAHCALSLAGQPAMTDWPAGAGETRFAHAEALALAADATLAPLAIERLTSLRAAGPASTTTRLLLARAMALAGQGAAAAQLHRELVQEGHGGPLVWREIARVADADGYVVADDVAARMVDGLLADKLGGSRATERFIALRLLPRAAGATPASAAKLASALTDLPTTRPLRADDVAAIADGLPPKPALATLAIALTMPQRESVRQLAVARLVALCEALAQSPEDRPLVMATASSRLAADVDAGCVSGRLLRFVAANDVPALVRDGVAWLRAHVEAVAAGRDAAEELPATVTALAAATSPAEALATIDAALARRPTALALWRARTELAVAVGEAKPAVRDLDAVLAHCDAPELRLLQLTLAAENRLAGAAELMTFAALPAELRDGPLGKYTLGVLALRQGQPDDALPLLADAPPRPDGMHLFAGALAALQSRAADGAERAHAAFVQLQRDYPSSSLARNAGRFANQLALR